MQMTEHIKALLYRYECVVIPEFGAFLTKRRPAQIIQSTNLLYPPTKAIVFNSQLKDNDGLLANQVAKSEKITYTESLSKIKDFVENINDSLRVHRQVRFDGIGLFTKQLDNIVFQPFINNNFLLEAYGMDEFKAETIQQKTSPVVASVKETAKEESEETSRVLALKEENTTIAPTYRKEDKERPIYWKYAAVGIIAIGIGGFLGANWYSSQVKTHNIAVQKQAEKQIENKIQQATFMMDNPLPEVVFNVSAKPQGKYHIVAGAFREKENADKKLKQLKSQGYKARYIGANKYGLHQVIYESLDNRKDALHELLKIKRQENPAAWLLVQDL